MGIEKKVKETIRGFKLFNKKDKVVVALSGGKDSTSALYILHKRGYKVSGLMIDLHLGEWSRKNRENMEGFCSKLGVELSVVDLKKELGQGICYIKNIVKRKRGLTGCSVCGIVKKWILNKYARKFGADVIVTGHNLDDEVQTILMNFLKGNVFLGANAGPVTGGGFLKQGGFVQRVKPLFFVPESLIREYSKKMNLPVLYERCPCAFGTYRVETRQWLNDLGLSNSEKLKIVNSWLKIAEKLRKSRKREIEMCEDCGEPCSKRVCNFCKIVRCV